MDFYVEDEEGRIFDVEMQKRNEGNIPKRTRFCRADCWMRPSWRVAKKDSIV